MARTRFYPIWMLPVLLLASCGGTPSASASSSQTSYATTSSLPSSESLTSTSPGGVVAGAEEIAKAADVYYDKIVTGSSLLAAAGLSGQEELTYGNVVNLFYQAFKDVLPAPTGGRYLCGAPSLDVSAAPSSYQTGLKFLMDHESQSSHLHRPRRHPLLPEAPDPPAFQSEPQIPEEVF